MLALFGPTMQVATPIPVCYTAKLGIELGDWNRGWGHIILYEPSYMVIFSLLIGSLKMTLLVDEDFFKKKSIAIIVAYVNFHFS